MTISVLISVYQNEKPQHLDEALDSIWTKQTLKPEQIILIQDGPVPQSLAEVIDRWRVMLGDVMTFIQNTSNIGLTCSLNKGIEAVRGDVVARMDSDDRSAPMRFQQQTDYLESHPDVDIVGGSIQEFDDAHECLNIRQYPLTHTDALAMIHKASPLAHPTVMMRRRIFDEGLRYNEHYRTSQDIALWFDAITRGYHIANLTDITLYFRSADNVYQRRSKKKAWNEFRIYMRGVFHTSGLFTMKYLFPISRLCFRLMPVSVIEQVYKSPLRKYITEGHSK